MPIGLAPPCVEPFTGDNGGATPGGHGRRGQDHLLPPPTRRSTRWARPRSATSAPTSTPIGPAGHPDAYVDLYNEYSRPTGARWRRAVRGHRGGRRRRGRQGRRHRHRREGALRGDRRSAQAPARSRRAGGPGHRVRADCAEALPRTSSEEYAPYLWQVGPDAGPGRGAGRGDRAPGRSRAGRAGRRPGHAGRGPRCTASSTTTPPTATTRPCSSSSRTRSRTRASS